MDQERGQKGGIERRRYYRITDQLVLQYRDVLQTEVAAQLDGFQEDIVDGFTLGARFSLLKQQMRPVLREIEDFSQPLARYLDVIDQKLSMLAGVLMAEQNDLSQQPARQVTLSACGMDFFTEHMLSEGAFLELRMILLPSMIGIRTYGKVVTSREHEGGEAGFRYRTGVDFIHPSEGIRELIAGHVIGKEAENLRRRRQGDSEP